MKSTKNLVWLDCEMSGLDPERHVILEIAVVITDSDLNILDARPAIVIHYGARELRSMEAWSRKHHAKSGLLREVDEATISCRNTESVLLKNLGRFCYRGKSPLCGKTIGHDRRFLARHMPILHEFFHYRSIDVTAIKELVERWYPRNCRMPRQKDVHRAFHDTMAAIDELKYYRERIFKISGASR